MPLDANTVISECVAAIYRGADHYKATRVGTWAGRVIPKSDGSRSVSIRVSINYPGGIERYAPIICTVDNVGNITLKDRRDEPPAGG